MATESTMEKGNALKKWGGFPPVFRYPLRPISNPSPYSSRPGARKPISVAILLDSPRKKRVMIAYVNLAR
jgi:hypothetical protein